MRSIKPGRGPSALGAAGSVFAIVIGIFWTIVFYSMTRDPAYPSVRFVFPLFGIGFVLFGVFHLIYNLKNTVSPNRFSLLDITDANSEVDSLERRFGAPSNDISQSVESRLRVLDELKAKGLINDLEHEDKRKKIIGEI